MDPTAAISGGAPPSADAQEESKKQKEQQKAAAIEQRQRVLQQILEPSAYERLSRISLVRPEKAQQIEDQLIRMFQQRQLSGKIDEQRLIKMLEQVGAKEHQPKVTIRRKIDDDSDDDFRATGGDDDDDDDKDDDYDSDDY